MARPLISVIVPVYNGEATIRRALDSVFTQNCDDLEVVVCDDGSTDGTPGILAEYGGRVTVIAQANRGRGAARNSCLRRATGQFIALLDADDWWASGKLELQLAAAKLAPHAGVFCGNAYIVNSSGQIYRTLNGEWHVGHSGWVFPFLIRQNFVPMPTALVRRGSADAAGLFDETLKRSQDLEWLIRLSVVTQFHYTPAPLAYCDDRNWGSDEKRLDTYSCFRELLHKTEARFPDLSRKHRHEFAKSHSDAECEVGRYHEDRGRFGEAALHYETALTYTPASRPLKKRRATALLRAGHPDAVHAYEEMLADDPYDQDARFHIGTLRLMAGDAASARTDLEAALYDGYLYQKFPECLNNLAVACAHLGEPERARELLEQACAQREFYHDAITNLQAIDRGTEPAALRCTPRKVF